MTSEISQSQKSHKVFNSTYIIVPNCEIIAIENGLVVARGWGW